MACSKRIVHTLHLSKVKVDSRVEALCNSLKAVNK